MQQNKGDILIIDDDPLVQMNFADALEDVGFNTSTAGTVAQAWSIIKSRSFDLIVCDHDLTDGKGVDIILKMEASSIIIPIIYLSAATTTILAEIAQHQLVKKVLHKPVEQKQLIQAIMSNKQASSKDNYPKLVGNAERRMLLDDLSL